MTLNTRDTITSADTTEILACIDSFERTLHEIGEWHNSNELNYADLRDFRDNFVSLVRNQVSPSEYFELIGNGSFKECYEGIGRWIVKFAGEHNATGAEQQILEAANEAGISWMFLKSIYLSLPQPLECLHLEECNNTSSYCGRNDDTSCSREYSCGDCNWNRRCEVDRNILDTAIFQPRAITAYEHNHRAMEWNQAKYMEDPILHNSGIPVDYSTLVKLNVDDHNWIQTVIDLYGDTNFRHLINFVDRFQLSDLRPCNIGYIETSQGFCPIIIDWLSAGVSR
jgi:hypothetical protein